MDDFELEKFVDYVYKTPSGGVLHLKNGAAIIIRGNDAEILSSLEEYHAKYKDNTSTWNELTNDLDKKKLYQANAAALTKIKWIEVETAVEAAQKLEAAEKRESLIVLIDSLVGRRALNDLLRFVVSFPLAMCIIWGLYFGLERDVGVHLSPLWRSVIIGFAVAGMYRCIPKNPGRVTFIMAAIGYLIIVLVIWKFG
jgi:hypothetical protein